MTNFWEQIEQYIVEDNLDVALEQLRNFAKSDSGLSSQRNSLLLLSARLARLQSDLALDVIGTQDARFENARIRKSLLFFMSELKKKQVNRAQPIISSDDVPMPSNFGSFEKIIGATSQLKKIAWLQLGLDKAKSVCRVVNAGLGTGFLLENGWLVTNHHVVPTVKMAVQTKVQFNYNEDIHGKLLQFYTYFPDSRLFFTSKALDLTVVKLQDNENNPPVEHWGFLKIAESDIIAGKHVTIIQHPAGGTQQIALNENRVTAVLDKYLQYTTDTLPGSSGSPVFNDNWELVGVHHAGGNLRTNAEGQRRFINQAIKAAEILSVLDEAQII